MDNSWEPPSTFEEKIRAVLVPPRLRMRFLLMRERLRGEAELKLLPFLIDRRRIALDIGANKGIWAEAMRRYAKHVHAFEPNPKIFRELKRSAHRAVTAHRLALSDNSGPAGLLIPIGRRGYSNQGARLTPLKAGISYGTLPVEARRLDEMDLGAVGFMKIDVEGHEMAVIAGAAETLRRYRPNLMVEIEEIHTGQPIRQSLDAICAKGYEAFALEDGTLKSAWTIDLTRRHSESDRGEGYIYNWIFFPGRK